MSSTKMDIQRIGFIGLGNMGFPMAARLIDAGFSLIVFDIEKNILDKFGKEYSVQIAKSLSELGKMSEVIITMLPDGEVVLKVVIGQDQNNFHSLLNHMREGTILIDMSSSAPGGTQKLGRILEANGIQFIDAPVSGGVKGANEGSLSILVGGNHATIKRCMPLFNAIGKQILEVGPLGSGHAVKALNNLVSAAGFIATAEALMIGKRFGLSPETIVDVLNASTGRNVSTERKFKQFVLSRKFSAGFPLSLMVKDLTTAIDLAHLTNTTAPFSLLCRELWAIAMSELEEIADHTAVVQWYERISDTILVNDECEKLTV